MLAVDLETSIVDFLVLGRHLEGPPWLTGERILKEFTTWYSQIRVVGAVLTEDADMLLLQWGAMRPLELSEPTDLRRVGSADIRFAEEAVRFLDFTRQVFAMTESDTEFDDAAVQMSLTLCYGLATGEEPHANVWVPNPDTLANGLRAVTAEPYVRDLLTAVPVRLVVTVSYCG
jgi:hypothetical protein